MYINLLLFKRKNVPQLYHWRIAPVSLLMAEDKEGMPGIVSDLPVFQVLPPSAISEMSWNNCIAPIGKILSPF